jgi:TonB family protein
MPYSKAITTAILLSSLVTAPQYPALAQTAEQLLKSYVGHRLILSHYGGKDEIEIAAGSLIRSKGGCDAAVEIKKTNFKKDKARLWLEPIGTPQIPNTVDHGCPMGGKETQLTISAVQKDAPSDVLRSILNQIIETPEGYLSAQGVRYDFPLSDPNEPVIDIGDESKLPSGITPPHMVLDVFPNYPVLERLLHVQGVVKVQIDVGTDGRVRNAHIVKSLNRSLDEQVLLVLPLDRYEPAQKDGRPVAVRLLFEMTFRLF